MGILNVKWFPGPEWAGYKFTPGERIHISILIESAANSEITRCTLKIQGNGYSTELSLGVNFLGFKDSLRVYDASNYWGIPPTPGVTYSLNYEVLDNLGEIAKQTTQIQTTGVYTPPPPPPTVEYTLIISTALGGTTNPTPGEYKYPKGTMISVTAIPQENYAFDFWKLDGVNVGSANPISFNMNTNHTLEPVFTYSPAPPPPTEGEPPVAPPVTPPPEEVPPTVEIIPSPPPPPTIIPPAPQVPLPPVTPETAGLIVLGGVIVIVIIGAAVWYFTRPPS